MFERLVLVVSGKMGSGKDTVAPAVMAELGFPAARHLFFSDALKGEVDDLFDGFRGGATDGVLASRVGGVSVGQVGVLRAMWEGLPAGVGARGRHPGVRSALQFWGTDVRRASDVDYWVRLTEGEVRSVTGSGEATFLTDARFPNEVSGFRESGAVALRLEVPEGVRLRRLRDRDGFVPSGEAQAHPSEVALDGWGGFDVVVENVGPLPQVVSSAAAAVAAVVEARGLGGVSV